MRACVRVLLGSTSEKLVALRQLCVLLHRLSNRDLFGRSAAAAAGPEAIRDAPRLRELSIARVCIHIIVLCLFFVSSRL